MINIHRLNEEIEKILEEETEEVINGLKLIPHGENSVKYYTKAAEYFKNHVEEVKSGFINFPLTNLGYEFKYFFKSLHTNIHKHLAPVLW